MPLYGQNVCPSTGRSALGDDSARGTYQRGANPTRRAPPANGCLRRPDRLPAPRGVGTAADVDAVIGVGGVAEDALVLLVERVHSAPCERDRVTQRCCLRGRLDMLPGGASRDLTVAADDVEPPRLPEIRVRGVGGRSAAAPRRRRRREGSTRPDSGPVRTGAARRRFARRVLPPSSTLILRRRGSRKSTRSGIGLAEMNVPLGLRPNGPCCQERPMVPPFRFPFYAHAAPLLSRRTSRVNGTRDSCDGTRPRRR